MAKSKLTALDIFKSKDPSNLDLEKDGVTLTLDGVQHKIAYKDVSPMEALLLRLVSKVEVLIDTSKIFEEELRFDKHSGANGPSTDEHGGN